MNYHQYYSSDLFTLRLTGFLIFLAVVVIAISASQPGCREKILSRCLLYQTLLQKSCDALGTPLCLKKTCTGCLSGKKTKTQIKNKKHVCAPCESDSPLLSENESRPVILEGKIRPVKIHPYKMKSAGDRVRISQPSATDSETKQDSPDTSSVSAPIESVDDLSHSRAGEST